jgi:hypothetical protein
MALITQYEPVQGNNGAAMDIFLTNNDPSAIYNSGQLNLEAMLGNVADSIIANNPAYSGLQEMMLCRNGEQVFALLLLERFIRVGIEVLMKMEFYS